MAKAKAVYVIVDTPSHSRAIQAGQPPTTLAAYRLDVDGQDQDETVGEFMASQGFPAGSLFGVASEQAVHAHHLAPRLEASDRKPGQPDA